MKILTATYVVPISADPIASGAVAIDRNLIADVGTAAALSAKYPNADVDDLGEAAIIPGFVNCHSHLEITAMRGALDRVENDFYKWLITLTKLRGEVLTDDDIKVAALAGAVEGARAGVTCFGDIGRMGTAGFEALTRVGLRGVLFQETEFSADSKTADVDFEKLREKFEALSSRSTELVEVGISPHAPYTVSREIFEKIAQFALDRRIKVSIHAAESQEEDDLLKTGTGFFTSVYEQFGVTWQSPLCTSIEFLDQTGILETQPLLAHCIRVSDGDIDILNKRGVSVAYCPKSNAKFGHGYAPFESMVDSGINVGLGTDSVASNNVCDLLDEARHAAFAARNRSDKKRFISERDVLYAATLGGAKALGLADKIGSLEPGKQADIAVINLKNIAQQPVSDVYAALVFSSNARDVSMTMVAGKEIYCNNEVPTADEPMIHARLNEIGEKIINSGLT
jgi:cytosine/adenosine deaminase-related metal-dependent hydrolase